MKSSWLKSGGTRAQVEAPPVELMTPTPEELRNGWTAETLTAYHRKQNEMTQTVLDWGGRPKKRPTMQARYNPLRWGSRGLIERT